MNAPTENPALQPLPAPAPAGKSGDLGDISAGLRDAVSGAEFGQRYMRSLGDLASMHARTTQEVLERLGQRQSAAAQAVTEALGHAKPADLSNYLVDAWERWVLFMDILRRRGNQFVSHEEQGCPPVLAYQYDVVVDGTKLERPVNYSLVSIRPPEGVTLRPNARPYIIIDPRAGHGSGIGGFKSESEVGVALHGGHPVYFCIFTTHPTRTQTLADVTRAEAQFVREVQRRHPDSPKPVVIGNCQGGWAAMLLAATNPDLTGPIVVNGTPLSYWAGTRGKNPMRYMGGLMGGIAPALLLSDLGNGQFDGANLVLNFETLNPGNTWWRKYYDVYADTEREAERYLEFERWWSGFYFMNESEMRWIVENLFVGNRIARGGAQLDSRMHVDLRNVRAPIVVFASHGDNITPPQQALNWITDAYSDVKEIKARGQRIVYTVHDSIGHLGIFVSSAVAKKEHHEIVSTLKAIEALSPGLYEMKIVEEQGEGLEKRFVVDFEERSIADLLALDDGRDDEKAFEAVSRLSNLGAEMYRLAWRPWVKAFTTSDTSRMRINAQPLRLRRYVMSDKNPMTASVAPMAEAVRAHRHKADPANPWLAWEKAVAGSVGDWFDAARDLRDAWMESAFYAIYASPLMRAIGSAEAPKISEVAGTDLRAVPEVRQALAQMTRGNAAVAVIRMLILLARSRKAVRRDRLQRSNELLTSREPYASMGEVARTRIIHQQSMIVEFEPDQALATLPMLVRDPAERERAMQDCDYVVGDPAEMNDETRGLYERIRSLLDLPARTPAKEKA